MPGKDKKLIAFPVYPGVSPLDLIGPLTVLRNLAPGTSYRTVVVGERVESTDTGTRLGIVPAAAFDDVPDPAALFVPGGGAAAVAAMEDPALNRYVRSAAAGAELVGSTGNGALVLAAAGVLDRRRAATHWAYRDLLEGFGATVAGQRWVEDGRYLTAAGGTAGMDLMLALLARMKSRSGAELAQWFMEYDPEPPFGVEPGGDDADLATLLRTPWAGASGAAPGERSIAVVLYPGLTALDLVGPLQVLAELERFAPQYRTVVVGARREPMTTDVGVRLVPDRTFEEVPRPFAVVLPGGRGATIKAMSDPGIRQYVRGTAATAELVGSVCTGSLILGAVGVLEGRPATTNWFFSGVLERLGGRYVRRRWVEDGNLIMSAGVSAGIDMALHLAARLTDEATARRVQLAVDYDPEPPFGGLDWVRIPPTARALRSTVSLAAPVLAARPKRLTREDRRVEAGSGRAVPT